MRKLVSCMLASILSVTALAPVYAEEKQEGQNSTDNAWSIQVPDWVGKESGFEVPDWGSSFEIPDWASGGATFEVPDWVNGENEFQVPDWAQNQKGFEAPDWPSQLEIPDWAKGNSGFEMPDIDSQFKMPEGFGDMQKQPSGFPDDFQSQMDEWNQKFNSFKDSQGLGDNTMPSLEMPDIGSMIDDFQEKRNQQNPTPVKDLQEIFRSRFGDKSFQPLDSMELPVTKDALLTKAEAVTAGTYEHFAGSSAFVQIQQLTRLSRINQVADKANSTAATHTMGEITMGEKPDQLQSVESFLSGHTASMDQLSVGGTDGVRSMYDAQSGSMRSRGEAAAQRRQDQENAAHAENESRRHTTRNLLTTLGDGFGGFFNHE